MINPNDEEKERKITVVSPEKYEEYYKIITGTNDFPIVNGDWYHNAYFTTASLSVSATASDVLLFVDRIGDSLSIFRGQMRLIQSVYPKATCIKIADKLISYSEIINRLKTIQHKI